MHYTQRPSVSLDDGDIYTKIVENRRGGFCMELNSLFGKALKTRKCRNASGVSAGATACVLEIAPPALLHLPSFQSPRRKKEFLIECDL